jgi:DNA-binding MarR family transcriptional regulator
MAKFINYRSDLSGDEKVLMAIVRAAETFKRVVSTLFRKYNLSFPQYNILRVLDASTDGQSRITEVSRIMLVSSANMTGLAKRLEKSGFLARKSEPRDERVTLLEITPKGKSTLADIELKRDALLEKMLKGFMEKEKKEMMILVRRILRNVRQMG